MDLPPEGLHLALQGVLDGTTKGIPVPYGSTNLTQERRQRDMADVRQELGEILDGLERIMDTATDADLEEAKVVIDFIGPAGKQEKNARYVVEGLFAGHWRTHLQQIADVRETLGID